MCHEHRVVACGLHEVSLARLCGRNVHSHDQYLGLRLSVVFGHSQKVSRKNVREALKSEASEVRHAYGLFWGVEWPRCNFESSCHCVLGFVRSNSRLSGHDVAK